MWTTLSYPNSELAFWKNTHVVETLANYQHCCVGNIISFTNQYMEHRFFHTILTSFGHDTYQTKGVCVHENFRIQTKNVQQNNGRSRGQPNGLGSCEPTVNGKVKNILRSSGEKKHQNGINQTVVENSAVQGRILQKFWVKHTLGNCGARLRTEERKPNNWKKSEYIVSK